jgi:S2P endopeptidase
MSLGSCSTSIHSVGASFVVALPAAFVALDAHSLSTRSNVKQLRVITAGAFHNVISYAVLVLCASSGVGSFMMTILGYTDTSQSGVVVVDVESVSDVTVLLSTY